MASVRMASVDGFDPRTSFGLDVSRRYDADPRGDEEETVAFLARLARGRNALEFARVRSELPCR